MIPRGTNATPNSSQREKKIKQEKEEKKTKKLIIMIKSNMVNQIKELISSMQKALSGLEIFTYC